MSNHVLFHDDCVAVLKEMPDNSIDSLVTDPPAGIGFMGKDWDGDKGGRKQWIAWMAEVMRECHRVLKPGAHGLVWALPRTSHWTATALEDAGFEVRDVVTHLFGSGFPKSLDVSKAIDKAAGVEREVIGSREEHNIKGSGEKSRLQTSSGKRETIIVHTTAPATDAAKKWAGFGTALKPASEHWILVRKPCSEKTVAANVLKWGTGALNIDASRVHPGDEVLARPPLSTNKHEGYRRPWNDDADARSRAEASKAAASDKAQQLGRFPANLVLSHTPYCTDEICDLECAIKMLDEQSGQLSQCGSPKKTTHDAGMFGIGTPGRIYKEESRGASRFFYCAKISKSERNAGLEGMEARDYSTSTGATRPNQPARLGANPDARVAAQNHHPTVKPKKLMTYLIRMVTPPGGAVLDPFMGSGSTGCAAVSEGFKFIGIEKELEYFNIAERRVAHSADASGAENSAEEEQEVSA